MTFEPVLHRSLIDPVVSGVSQFRTWGELKVEARGDRWREARSGVVGEGD